jgi:Tol biopolymer transport system component
MSRCGSTCSGHEHWSEDLLYAWSPDARKLVVATQRRGISRILLLNLRGKRLADLTPTAKHPRANRYRFVTWSPDGRWIGFERFREEHRYGCSPCIDEYDLMRPNGSGLRRVFSGYGSSTTRRPR